MDKGKTEGKMEEKEALVERCWKENISTEFIAKLADLSTAEILLIIEKIKG